MRFIFLFFISLILLSACSMFSPVNTGPTNTYMLNISPQPATKKPIGHINVVVPQPTTSPIYNTTDIAYTTHPYQIAYLAKSAWAETPPQMLQPLIIDTLQKTHYFYSVGSPTEISQYRYILNTQIIKLEQDFSYLPNTVRLVLRAQIIDASTSQILATKEFAASEMIQQNNTYAGIQAANRATARVLKQLANFCLRYMK